MVNYEDVKKAASIESNLKHLAEGKTKQIYGIEGFPDKVVIRSKDSLTAHNAQRKNTLEGKARIANETTCKTLGFLQKIGIRTHFVCRLSDTEFIADNCTMVPIEWVARRLATGSFLKRCPGVREGFRFAPAKIETFFKDDEAGDPQWSDEQIIEALGYTTGQVAMMRRSTTAVFEALERAWASAGCQLIEFGTTSTGELLVADVIDNDSWRVWPKGDKRLMLDKQIYRDMSEVTTDALKDVLSKYEQVCTLLDSFAPEPHCKVVIIAGSASDMGHCEKIRKKAVNLGLLAEIHISSAHKAPVETLALGAASMCWSTPCVLIAVAGRSNGLGPVLAGSSPLPVINCPPPSEAWGDKDIWSSLRMPSGMGCVTVLDAEEAALAAAKMLAHHDHVVFGSVLGEQLNNYIKIFEAEHRLVKPSNGP